MVRFKSVKRSWLLSICGLCATLWLLTTVYLIEHAPSYLASWPHSLRSKRGQLQVEVFDEKHAESLSSRLGSHNHSIIFIKAFKVGGTTISSLLTSYAFNRNLSLLSVNHICDPKVNHKAHVKHLNSHVGKGNQNHSNSRKSSESSRLLLVQQSARLNSRISKIKCAHIYGTNHPPIPCGHFSRVNSSLNKFCLPPQAFIMLREPKERLWSGYRHEAMLAGGHFPLKTFLLSNSVVKVASNDILFNGTGAVEQAIKLAKSMNILFHHLYDESLVYMAIKAGLTLCDIMYVPCDKSKWEASKCNLNTTLDMTTEDRRLLAEVTENTGEQKFYDTLLASSEKNLKTEEISLLTKLYRNKKALALKYCSSSEAIEQTIGIMKAKKGVSHNKAGIYHYFRERTNPLDPMTVCLSRYCARELL